MTMRSILRHGNFFLILLKLKNRFVQCYSEILKLKIDWFALQYRTLITNRQALLKLIFTTLWNEICDFLYLFDDRLLVKWHVQRKPRS